MEKLMDKDIFRKALEDAIKGKSANQASFSKAWASGKLEKKHFLIGLKIIIIMWVHLLII